MKTEWHDLIQRHLAGLLSDAEARRFKEALLNQSEVRQLYFQYVDLDLSLAALADSAAAARREEGTPVTSEGAVISRGGLFIRAILGAAAVLAVGAGLGLEIFKKIGTDGIARIVESRGTRWEASTLPTEEGSSLTRGRLRLVEGIARIRFARGAEITLEGPAEMELIGPQECRLFHGSLLAHVPQRAIGFRVITARATLIDHGTDFGIVAEASGHARVQVMRGAVELRHSNGMPPVRLTSLQMASITPDALLPGSVRSLEVQRVENLPQGMAFSAELTTRFGRGAAAYVAESRAEQNQSATLLLIKHCAEEGYGRKALMRFDLGSIRDAGAFIAARLVLHLAPSGFGYASQGDDARIGVYALTNDSADAWEESTVGWETQPAFHSSAGRVDAAQTVRLGEFVVPRGVQSGAVAFESEELLARVKADTNRLLTLIFVREDRIERGGGLVLGIVGNNHPTLPPPTLRLR
jgi:hypothetical protein